MNAPLDFDPDLGDEPPIILPIQHEQDRAAAIKLCDQLSTAPAAICEVLSDEPARDWLLRSIDDEVRRLKAALADYDQRTAEGADDEPQ